MPRNIIVSDLHVDYWDDRLYGPTERSKPKLQHWFDFLDWCEAKEVDELIINGDITDAPPYRGNASFTSEIECQAISHLASYASRRKVTYVFGNHDIGISGIRCMANPTLPLLTNLNLVYPDYVFPVADSTFLVQHGHLYDPFLALYIKDLTTRTYIQSKFQAFTWIQQRRDPTNGESLGAPGVLSPAKLDLAATGNNLYHAIQLDYAVAPPSPAQEKAARRWIKGLARGVISKIGEAGKELIWWQAAKHIIGEYLEQCATASATIYCIMGHTHLPDTAEDKVVGRNWRYFNSGTWTGAGAEHEDRKQATYLDVREDGRLWVQDWIWDRYLGD